MFETNDKRLSFANGHIAHSEWEENDADSATKIEGKFLCNILGETRPNLACQVALSTPGTRFILGIE